MLRSRGLKRFHGPELCLSQKNLRSGSSPAMARVVPQNGRCSEGQFLDYAPFRNPMTSNPPTCRKWSSKAATRFTPKRRITTNEIASQKG